MCIDLEVLGLSGSDIVPGILSTRSITETTSTYPQVGAWAGALGIVV